MLQRLIDSAPYDDISTPHEALEPLLPYLPKQVTYGKHGVIVSARYWEMCPGDGVLSQHLNSAGYNTIYKDSGDSLETQPEMSWDIAITNPPYSNKHEWLQRCQELNKPFALLLPVTTLGVRRCQIWMDDVDVLFLPKRIDFTGKGAPWFAVAWFTKGLLPERMIFSGVEND